MIVVKNEDFYLIQRSIILQSNQTYSFDFAKEAVPESKTGSNYFTDAAVEEIKTEIEERINAEEATKRMADGESAARVAKEKAEKAAKKEAEGKLKKAE